MKHRISLFVFIACSGVFSLTPFALALSPQPKDDSDTTEQTETLPLSQEATEGAILPDEPLLSTPTPEPSPDYVGLPVQPLPTRDITQPSGPTIDEQRLQSEAFRVAKTEAEEQPTLDDIKIRAFAAPTEREKRALLREYYQAIGDYIEKKSPTLKNKAQLWAYAQQNRLSRSRTEPDYQSPTKPAALVKAKPSTTDNSNPEEKTDFLPSLDNQ